MNSRMKNYITRKIKRKKKKGYDYEYYDKTSNKVTNEIVECCLEGLYLPPAHDDVKINLNKKAKIRAIGYDNKGRAQYTYNKKHTEKQSKSKFNHMIKFGESYKKILSQINRDLFNESDSKEKQIASVLKLVIDCSFRIGNDKYSKENKSYGVTTLENRHIKVTKDTIKIDFVGKKGVRNICKVTNKKLSKNLRTKKRTLNKNDRIFTYRVKNKYYNIKSSDVNKYLKNFGDFTAKNFRTWGANLEFIQQLVKCENEDSENKKKKQISEVLQKVAHKLHNTASVCRSNYIDPYLIELFTNDSKRFNATFNNKTTKEEITDGYLELLRNKV
jgi:DNA topoisomerase-1